MSENTAAPVPPSDVLPAIIPDRNQPVAPLALADVRASMNDYQHGVRAILDESDWQRWTDRDGREQSFVKRAGLRKIALWFGLDLEIVGEPVVERDEHGNPVRARVVARAVAPNGRHAEDVGACSITERRFSKPEHDLVATAATRALNRAVADLIGMGDQELVSAEEVPPDPPAWGRPATVERANQALDDLTELVGSDRAFALMRALRDRYGLPDVAVGVIHALRSMLPTASPPTSEGGQ